MVNGRSVDRPAHRVASVTSMRLDRRRAQIAKDLKPQMRSWRRAWTSCAHR